MGPKISFYVSCKHGLHESRNTSDYWLRTGVHGRDMPSLGAACIVNIHRATTVVLSHSSASFNTPASAAHVCCMWEAGGQFWCNTRTCILHYSLSWLIPCATVLPPPDNSGDWPCSRFSHCWIQIRPEKCSELGPKVGSAAPSSSVLPE